MNVPPRGTRTRSKHLIALLLLTGAGDVGAQDEPALRELDAPTGAGSRTPSWFVTPGGDALLSWLAPEGQDGDGHALRFATLTSGPEPRWSDPRTIARSTDGPEWFVNWADFPSLVVLRDGTLAAHWLTRHPTTESPYAYDVRVVFSTDGGASFGTPFVLHDDGTATEHGFVSLVPQDDDRVHAVWLDGRATGGGHGAESAGAMTLRAGVVGADGKVADEALLDARVCDCCSTATVRTPSGVVVAYRDRSDAEVRDVSIVRRVGNTWSDPHPLHEDGWVIAGCPVDGPRLAAEGSRVAAAWYTAADEEPTVKLALSSDEGESFGEPATIDDGDPIGRPDVVLLSNGDALVAWMERTTRGAEIRMRRVDREGHLAGPSRKLVRTWGTRSSGFLRLAFTGERVLIAWTDASDPMRVRTGIVTP